MGERGNIVFHYRGGKRVYLYTHLCDALGQPRLVGAVLHWRGDRLHEILREAMNHREENRVHRGGVRLPAAFGPLTRSARPVRNPRI